MTDAEQAGVDDRVAETLRRAGIPLRPHGIPPGIRSAQDTADALDTDLARIVKSLVFVGAESDRVYLVLVDGTSRADEAKTARQFGEPLTRPKPRDVERRTGFSVGDVSPLGHAEGTPVAIDVALRGHDEVFVGSGRSGAVIALSPAELERASGGAWAELT
jgi:prolyl-tRNA editing enzyme YbaK/EbsC (Cys-tRNA(Pro) deacylase)